MMQELIVAALVIAACVASAWRLMPAKLKLRTLLALDVWAGRHPRLNGWRDRLLKPRIARAAGSSCGGCAANVSRPQHPRR
jgi:hypothetical protein